MRLVTHPTTVRPSARLLPVAGGALALAVAACGEEAPTTTAVRPTAAAATAAGSVAADHRDASDPHRQYGVPVRVGQGRARAYVVYDQKHGGAPTELGVALDEQAMHGLRGPAPHSSGEHGNGHEHLDSDVYLLALPARGVAPFQFVELDWNPGGHEPPGVYDVPHFDFHFWTASREVRAAIVPSDAQYQQKAERLPPVDERPPFNAVAAPPGAPAPGVPLMGVHWVDTRTPELQPPGSPGYRPFTTTFLWGSWDGRFHFIEPMITRAFLLSRRAAATAAGRDTVMTLAQPARVGQPGYYPRAYRITWDAQAREYRIALTQLARRE